MIRLGFDRHESAAGCPIARTYSRAEAKALLEAHGFTVTELKVDHIFPWEIEAYRAYQYRKVWWFRWIPRAWFRQLERWFGWHILITARPDARA